MLRLMLNAHPEVAVPPESRFIVELWHGSDTVDVAGYLDELAAHKRFQAWDLPIEGVAAELDGETVRYATAIDATFSAWMRAAGRHRWGDKTPRYIEHIPFIARLFRDAKFIHLIRDGRNVALSYSNVPFGPKSVAAAAELWATRVGRGLHDGRSLGGDRYLEIRYEDLVEDAEGEVKDICDFLELDFDPGMLDYTERARSAVLPRAAQYNPKVLEKPKASRAWQNEMPARDVEVFEAVAGDVLSQLGYERRYPEPSPGARARARLSKLRNKLR